LLVDALGTDFDTALTRGALVSLAVAASWSLFVVLAIALEARTGGRVRVAAHTGCPPALRAWLLGAFVALFAGIAPAQASDSGPPSGPHAGPHTDRHTIAGSAEPIATALEGLPLPDRPTSRPGRRAPTVIARVVVRPGDSLWRIARDRLPVTATDVDVSRAVDSLYAANRQQIGPDPDRIRPGQHLDFPDPTTLPEER
jgi:nucleoid-associated protein YgaU